MISFENISKGYGSQTLFDEATFKINPRERVGLVGRNGHGKTTIMRLIIGAESLDDGRIAIPKNYRIGYVKQHIDFTEKTVLAEGMLGLPESEKDHAWRVEKVLFGLGFSAEDMSAPPESFSGGYQVRLNLAKVLVSDPDLLLLDEPTNYLDITSVRWIEQFLKSWPRELMLITHDRSFMDNVVTHVVGIARGKLKKFPGNTEKFYLQIAQEEEIYEKTRVNDEKQRKDMELFISRFRAKARLANMVQSRIKTLAKMEKKEKLGEASNLEFSFRSRPFRGKQIMQVEDLSFGYDGGEDLIKNLSLHVKQHDRVCIIGKNGKGKTTLLKLLAGVNKPRAGKVKYNPGVEKGFYEQTNVESLMPSRSIEEEILLAHPDVDTPQARGICGAMMFTGDQAMKKIAVLSGGEKSRVMLGKLLVTPLNLLLLDEPTNHLDMETCDSMLAAIDDFDGAVVMVTHNEMYLHTIARKLIVFKNDRVFVFEGSYAEFLEKEGWDDGPVQDENPPCVQASLEENSASTAGVNRKEFRRLKSELIRKRSRELGPLKKKIEKLEAEIGEVETLQERLNAEMLEASQAQDGEKITSVSRELHGVTSVLDDKYEQLMELEENYEEKGTGFNAQIAELTG